MSEFEDLAKRVKEPEIENLRLQSENRARMEQLRDLERSYDITLQALGDALDLKDRETEGHSRRVTAFTMAIAGAMGLPPSPLPPSLVARSCTISARYLSQTKS